MSYYCKKAEMPIDVDREDCMDCSYYATKECPLEEDEEP